MTLITDVQNAPGKQILNVFLEQQTDNIRILLPPQANASLYDAWNIDVVTGSLNTHPSLDKALNKVDTLIITHSNFLSDLRKGYINLLYSALGAGVKYIIYVSSILTGNSSCIPAQENVETETAIRNSGIVYTILRRNILMEQMPIFIGNPLSSGKILFPGGNGRISFTSSDAIARVVTYFIRHKPKVSATYKISSAISYSFTDIANILSAISEMPICYSPVERSFFRKSLLNDSIPPTWTDRIVSVAKSIEMNEFDVPDFTLFRLLERAKKEQEKISKRSLSYWLGREQERVHTGKNKNLSDYLKEVYLS